MMRYRQFTSWKTENRSLPSCNEPMHPGSLLLITHSVASLSVIISSTCNSQQILNYSPACPALTRVIYVTSMGDQGRMDGYTRTNQERRNKQRNARFLSMQLCRDRKCTSKKMRNQAEDHHWCIFAGGAG
uniref:Uncharacterized protein n=1 Tax=Arundo donax TaxID=35708 RepID=A0A0A9EY83_ARUDO